ncbi:MAG: phosphatase PAP2 family protein [Pseudomonadota bacterium]
MLTGGLMMARDGLIGAWVPPAVMTAFPAGEASNLELWGRAIRDMVIAGELASRLGYHVITDKKAPGGKLIAVSHLCLGKVGKKGIPEVTYAPFLRYTRPKDADFLAQLDIIHNYADLRGDRSAEILTQADQTLAYFATAAALDSSRTKHTIELLGAAHTLAATVSQQIKHALACIRPDRLSAQIQPMIPTPRHGALPSGHATEAFIVARVLQHLLTPVAPGEAGQLQRLLMGQAHRIATNRTVAGVHYPVDSLCGASLGLALGDYLVARAGKTGTVQGVVFDGQGIGARDFFVDDVIKGDARCDSPGGQVKVGASDHAVKLGKSDVSPHLAWLWEKAEREWDDVRPAGA